MRRVRAGWLGRNGRRCADPGSGNATQRTPRLQAGREAFEVTLLLGVKSPLMLVVAFMPLLRALVCYSAGTCTAPIGSMARLGR